MIGRDRGGWWVVVQVKANVLAFSGLVYEGSANREKVMDKAKKLAVAELKEALDTLGEQPGRQAAKREAGGKRGGGDEGPAIAAVG